MYPAPDGLMGAGMLCAPLRAGVCALACLGPRIRVFVSLTVPMPRSASDRPPAALPATYEAALQELEQLVTQLESGQMPLDQLLAGYQRGAALLALCKDKLQAVEAQIQILDGGQMKPWNGA